MELSIHSVACQIVTNPPAPSSNLSDDIFWTSSIVPLLIIGLHFLRHQFIPERYKHRTVLLYDHDEETKQDASLPKLPLHNAQHTPVKSALQQPDDTDILYEDAHLIIVQKQKYHYNSLRISFSHAGSFGIPSQNSASQDVLRFSIVATLSLVQCYVFYKATDVTLRMVEVRAISHTFALFTLLLPAASLFLSSCLLGAISMAVQELPDEVSQRDHFLARHIPLYICLSSWTLFLLPIWGLISV